MAVDGFWGQGGTERQIVAIATGMAARGWSTRVIVRWGIDLDGEHASELRNAGVALVTNTRWQRRRPLRGCAVALAGSFGLDTMFWNERAAYAWQVRQFRAGAVVHEIPYFGHIPRGGRHVYARTRLPLVQTILGTPTLPVEPATAWAEVTSDGGPSLTDPRQAITWIPCMTSARPDAIYRPPRDEIVLLFVGRLVKSKGLDLLIAALREASPRLMLRVVGDGPERPQLEALADSRTTFLGSLGTTEVLDAVRDAHVLVVPSRRRGVQLAEGMPTVISEAMSQARPVLATAVGGIPRVFQQRDPPPGWLVEPDSVESLREGLCAVLQADLSKASKSAISAYRQILRPQATLDAYEQRYLSAMANCECE